MASPERLLEIKKPSSFSDIERLITPEGSLYASAGEAYQYMLFGRDSLEAADDLLESEPRLALNVIDSLARIQGTTYDEATAEEPGKIPHQHMQLYVDGQRIPPEAENQLRKLAQKWGGDEESFTYYGSLDATPLFARLIARYGVHHGTNFLNETIENKAGETITRVESFRRSLNWLCDHLDSSELSLLEFRRLNDSHIIVQSWRDSGSSYVHEDGTQANLDGFIAPVEVQGYAYDALSLGSDMLQELEHDDEEVDKWREHAQQLQQTTIDRFWINDNEGFAMAIDRNEQWQPRQVRTPSSSQGALLDTRLFFDLEETSREKYVSAIVKRLYSPDFITDVGIRCRAASAADLVPFADYHGSWAVWTKETYDFAKGLWRHGLTRLAEDLRKRILNMNNISGENYEFLYVNPQGDVDYEPKKYTQGMDVDELIIATSVAEKCQAWTVSAILATKRGLKAKHHFEPSAWGRTLESQIFTVIPEAKLVADAKEILAKRAASKRFAIDTESGVEADKNWNPHWWA